MQMIMTQETEERPERYNRGESETKPSIDWRKLRVEELAGTYRRKLQQKWASEEETRKEWEDLTKMMIQSAEEICGQPRKKARGQDGMTEHAQEDKEAA